jgi:hypothetical protein
MSKWWSNHQERQQRYWSRLRSRGKRAFLWRGGVLSWALPIFLFVLCFDELIWPLVTGEPLPSIEHLLLRILVGVSLWIVIGLLFGLWLWHHPSSAA